MYRSKLTFVFAIITIAFSVNCQLQVHNRVLQTTNICSDSNCDSCLVSNKLNCLSCKSGFIMNAFSGNNRCLSCFGCLLSTCSTSIVPPRACTSCSSSYDLVISNTLNVNLCAKKPTSEPASAAQVLLGFLIFIGIGLGGILICCGLVYCCNSQMHQSYSFENIVLHKQPPPFMAQQPMAPMGMGVQM